MQKLRDLLFRLDSLPSLTPLETNTHAIAQGVGNQIIRFFSNHIASSAVAETFPLYFLFTCTVENIHPPHMRLLYIIYYLNFLAYLALLQTCSSYFLFLCNT